MDQGAHSATGPSEDLSELIQQLREAEPALEKVAHGRAGLDDSVLAGLPGVLRKAQRALQQCEIKHRGLVSRLPAIVCELSPDGTTIYVNEAITKIAGYQREEVVGKNWWELFYPGQQRRQVDALYERFESGPVTDYEMTLTAKDGTTRIILWDSADPSGPGATTANIIGIGVDVTARKLAEEKAVKLAAVVESSEDAITSVDLTRTIVSWNEGAERLYGYSADEAIGQPVSFVCPPDRIDELSTCLERLEQGEKIEYLETHRVRKDGQIVDVSLRLSPVKDGTGRILGSSGIARDISERRRIEEALEFVAQRGWVTTGEEFFPALVQYLGKSVDADYAIVDKLAEDRETAETVAVYARGKVLPNLSYSLRGTPCDNVMAKKLCCYTEGVQALFPHDQMLVDMGAESYVGLPLWDSRGGPLGLIAVLDSKPLRDPKAVSALLQLVATRAAAELERKLTEETLRQREETLRCFIEYSNDGIALIDPLGSIGEWNPSMEQITGLKREEVLGRKIWDVQLQLSRPEKQNAKEHQRRTTIVRQLLYGPEVPPENLIQELPVRRPDGVIRTVETSWFRVETAEGFVIGSISRDITDRKQAEEALQRSEERFRLLADNAQDMVYRLRFIPELKFEYASPAASAMAGRSPEEYYGNPHLLLDLAHPDDLPRLERYLADPANADQNFEMRWIRKDGRVVWTEQRNTLIYDETGMVIAVEGIARDITGRKRIEDTLRQRERELRTLLDSLPAYVVFKDVNGAYITANQKWCEEVGCSLDELPGKTQHDVFPKDLADKYLTDDRLLVATGEPLFIAEEEQGLDEDRIIVETYKVPLKDENGTITGLIGLSLDLTERKRSQEMLRQREREVMTLLDSLPAYAFFKDANGAYITANQRLCDAVGCTKDEIVGKTDYDLFPPDLAKIYDSSDAKCVETGEDLYTVEEEMIDGTSRVPVSTRKVLLRNEDGLVTGFIGLAFDISERKQMEEQLLRAQRLETAGKIAGQVAHDFNNLLAPLAGYPELIKRELPQGHPAGQFCDIMLEATRQMADINQDLMTLARRGHFNQELLDLNDLARQAMEHLPNRPFSLSLEFDLADELKPVKGSPVQLLRVISNLLTNAREAMQDSGSIVIRTRNVQRSAEMESYSRAGAGNYVRLEVSDSGCGIPVDVREKVFDAFFTTKVTGKRRGSGLGLSIVQTIIEDHRGFVELESEEGKGTTFSVYVPACEERPERQGEAVRQGGSESILVVDDDAIQREVTGQLLESLGYKVSIARDGEAALAFLEKSRVDLLILDMIMPEGIDGAETYRRVLELHPGQRAIILSGFAASDRVREAQSLGAGTYIRKPVTLDALAGAVRQELDRRD